MRQKQIRRLLLAMYLILLLMITVVRPWRHILHFMGGRVNTALFTEYLPVWHNGHYGMVIYFFLGNLIWFVPFGFYLVHERGRSLYRTVLAGFLLSLFIEVMQYVLGTGITEVDDLVLNTAGCLIGALLARFVPHHKLSEKMC